MTRAHSSDREYLTAKEAAAYLDIKLATLYAYTSRKLVSSMPAEQGKGHLYRTSDLERLKQRHDARAGHVAAAATSVDSGAPVVETSITKIDCAGPSYREHLAVDLARTGHSFEAVATLLWSGELPVVSPTWSQPDLGLASNRLAVLLPVGTSPLAGLMLGLSALACQDPERFGASEEQEMQRAGPLIRSVIGLCALQTDSKRVAAAMQASDCAHAWLIAMGVTPRRPAVALVHRALILVADHECNASTFAARIAASTGADLYACLLAGLAALSGPRHGAACDRIAAMLESMPSKVGAREFIRARLSRAETIYGFGHPLYPDGDPRASCLLESAVALAPRNPNMKRIVALQSEMVQARRESADIDTALLATVYALGLPANRASLLFAVGRTAGWIAHSLEQRRSQILLRPRAKYLPQLQTGPSTELRAAAVQRNGAPASSRPAKSKR